ncbi:hypothetical protein KEM60_00983 [Austwickia sp. TVS 96-490-7B]|uniref:HNH endonuclease family protein n=1 Tax=Austwickia sp. TVS 96-490-7B TaxID=2830843 RepID=UPI001C569F67|nr:HNH endonuclease family protein [Austwickia sp. TVS 96-490-7B]MBW3084794.1 hypothetical protein [Austwickia sp. TVS 96-490-7B]
MLNTKRWMLTAAVTVIAIVLGIAAAMITYSENTTDGPRQNGLRVVASRQKVSGYERDCGKGKGCVFGTRWSDDHPGLRGHNKCDTRNDLLASQGHDVVKDGACTVATAVIDDPYTGQSIRMKAGQNPSPVEIDHIYPLALAWDMGASKWDQARRVQFANDQDANLVAAEAKANHNKKDKGPGLWLPPNKDYVKTYVCKFRDVALKYDLAVTAEDAKAITEHCPVGTKTS